MQIHHNHPLQAYNTFGIAATANAFAVINNDAELLEVLKDNNAPIFILGGGSNLLLRSNLEGLVLKNEIKGRTVISETEDEVLVQLGGGENWHETVIWTLEQGWSGIENLSLIPGTVGAAPIQNIGAYGVELKDVFESLTCIHLDSLQSQTFTLSQCQFGYRDSIFKRALKGKVFITQVVLRLYKKPRIRISYGAIQATLNEWEINSPSPKDVSNAVIHIRQSKLPDPAKIGNSGSFFKNPEIERPQFLALQKLRPDLVFYELPNQRYKIPAGWLIEQAGWKGKRIGNCGSHSKQALVLVNYGNATGEEIWKLALQIQASVQQQFGIELSPEVNIWGDF